MGKLFTYLKFGFFAAIAIAIVSSFFNNSDGDVRLVDLDVVLNSMITTLNGLDGGGTSVRVNPATNVEEDSEKTSVFLAAYHSNINEAKMVPGPVGVAMEEQGSVLGFDDANGDNAQGSGEGDLFRVEIDAENSRLVASDLEHGYHRDSGFSMGGLMTGYFLGRMLTGQQSAGIRSSKFANMTMSKPGYAAAAKSGMRSSAKASRGSRSFSLGK